MTAAPLLAPPPAAAPTPLPPPAHRRLLTVAIGVGAVALAVALIGLVVDPRSIEGAPAWLKPAKFGVSVLLYLVAIRWMLGVVTDRRRLLAVLATVMLVALTAELVAIDVQVLRGTTSHFNESTPFDTVVYLGMGGLISTVFVVTAIGAVLVLRTRDVDRTIAAGMRWGLLVSLAGMAEAVLMTVNSRWHDAGGHTVGGVDGGPGLPLTGWSTLHGDLRIGHFLGLHALQVLPLLAFLLARLPLPERVRTRLLAVAGGGYGGLLLLTTWQALRGQALLSPDALTLAVAAALLLAVAAGTAVVLVSGRRSAAVERL